MTVAARLNSLTSRLVPSRSSGESVKNGQDQGAVQQTGDTSGDSIPPLRPVTFTKIIPFHQSALSNQGWSTITYDNESDKLLVASQALFKASQAFFDLPISYKQTFQTDVGSEEGWSRIEGEKELLTLRCLGNTPKELKEAAATYWAEAGDLLDDTLGRIATSLGLPAEALSQYSSPCSKLHTETTATMLRLFRYEGFEGKQSKTVAEPHRDLGLLSLVTGDTPGLEVWDRYVQKWFQIERTYEKPASSLLVGRELERLSNARYRSGGHLVRSYPDPPGGSEDPVESPKPGRSYRFSIVFVLRGHSPVPVNTDALTTSITGLFQHPIKDVTAGELFKTIQSAHFNINTQIQEREEQRQRLAELKKPKESTASPETRADEATG